MPKPSLENGQLHQSCSWLRGGQPAVISASTPGLSCLALLPWQSEIFSLRKLTSFSRLLPIQKIKPSPKRAMDRNAIHSKLWRGRKCFKSIIETWKDMWRLGKCVKFWQIKSKKHNEVLVVIGDVMRVGMSVSPRQVCQGNLEPFLEHLHGTGEEP